MNTPSSVSVLTGQTAQSLGIETARDIADQIPNVFGSDTGGNRMTNFTIRGVAELGYQSSPGVSPGIGYYVDDVPALTSLARASLFSSVNQISVLKGPQSSGFGFSRPGGVIDIRSAEPSQIPSGYLSGGFGNFKAYEAGAGISTPIGAGNNVFFTGDFLTRGRDGFYNNAALNQPYGDKEAYAGRGRLTIKPSDNTVVDLFVQHQRFNDQSDPCIPFAKLATDPRTVTLNDPGYERIGQDMQALRIKTRLEGIDFTSVTSHRLSTWNYRNDGDLTAAPVSGLNPYARLIGLTDETVRTFTQEFRASSNSPGAFVNWSAGFLGARSTMDFDAGTLFYPDIPMSLRHSKTTNNDIAAFGELKLALSDQLTLIPGLRYEWAGRDATNKNIPPAITSASQSFDSVLPSLALVYTPQPGLSTFAKYTRGFKPGGFIADRSTAIMDDFRFDTEASNNYEVGFKNIMMGGRVVLNGSVFYSDYDNYQVLTQFSASNFGVNNAQRVRSYGGELEGSYYFTPEVRAFAGIGSTDAKFVEFRNGYGTFTGNKVSFVPEFTANYGLEYRAGWGGYGIVNVRTLGDYYLDQGNANKQKGVSVVNATLGIKQGNWDVSVFARNLFNERYVVNVYDFKGTGIGAYGTLADPRTFGVRSRVVF